MRSIQLVAQRTLEERELPQPPDPGHGEITVRIRAVGVCGSDVHWYQDGRVGEFPALYPQVLGPLRALSQRAQQQLYSLRVHGRPAGAGPMGMLCAAVARAAGASRVFIADRLAYRLELARAMGADVAIHTTAPSLVETVMDATRGRIARRRRWICWLRAGFPLRRSRIPCRWPKPRKRSRC